MHTWSGYGMIRARKEVWIQFGVRARIQVKINSESSVWARSSILVHFSKVKTIVQSNLPKGRIATAHQSL